MSALKSWSYDCMLYRESTGFQEKRLGPKKKITLYRGLGLPPLAINYYKTYLESGDAFTFTGFTSTSCEESGVRR